MRSLVRLSVVALAISVLGAIGQGSVIYVNRAATGANNGSSWADAFVELRDALPTAGAGDQVWVAAGTYKPAATGGSVDSRFNVNGVALLGGFRGSETSVSQRDWVAYPTILSGDLNGDDGPGFGGPDNSHRIVDVLGGVLDGVVVTGASGFQIVGNLHIGHAASVRDGQIRHCTFRWNGHGALDLWTGGALSDSVFYKNGDSDYAVVAMHELEIFSVGPPTGPCSITNCTFYDNAVSSTGNGIVSDVGFFFGSLDSGSLSNAIFWGNQGVAIPEWRMNGSRMSGCLIDPPLPASWYYPHISGDPLFVSPATYDFRLQPNSPCIDAGTNTAVNDPASTDMDGNPRRMEVLGVPNTGIGSWPLVDIGAFEAVSDCNGNGNADFVEVSQGLASDVNENTVLDVCEPVGTGMCFGDLSLGVACPCGNQSAVGGGAGCVNSAGRSALLTAVGQARVSDDSVTLFATGMGTSAPALYFQGDAIDAIYGPGGVAFGDGLRCAFGAVIRLGIKLSSDGASRFGAGVGSDPRVSVRGAIPPGGGTRYYQVWYRDGATFCTASRFNTSNGLAIAWGA